MMMKRRILHVVYSFNAGGLENGLVNLINYLPSDQFSHVLCVLSEGILFLSRLNRNISWYELHKKDGNDLSLPFKIASIIQRERIDIVHTRNWASLVDGISGALLSGRRQIVHSEHGKEIEDVAVQPLRRTIAQRVFFRFARRVVTVSKALRDEIVANRFCEASKVIFIANGIDKSRFHAYPRSEILEYRRMHGIPDDGFVIGYVGRLARIKNLKFLIDICALDRIKGQCFVLVGDGPDRQVLQREVHKRSLGDCFIFLGYRENIPQILSMFDVFVNTSFYEGISNTVLEAMACGVPVVATNVGGTSEIIDNGKTGYLIEPENTERFIECLSKLRSDSGVRNAMSYLARCSVEEKFSLDSMIRRYRDVYSSL